MCKVSIITPVYRVEKYLPKCIDSILAQTFQDYELIIVDDGSPDSCGKIADDYAQKDARIRVIHKANGGAPSARNAGIKIAKGDYFLFPDSDDWIEPAYLHNMVMLAERSRAEVVISGYTMEYYEQGRSQTYEIVVEEKQFTTQEQVRKNLHHYFNNMMMAVPWNKLYKANYIREHNILFPDLKWDDLHFNMDIIMDIQSVAISSSSGYHFFRSRQGSETTSVFDGMLYSKRKEQFEHILKVYQYWNMQDKDILSVIYGYYGARMVQCIQEIAICDQPDKSTLIRNILNDDLSEVAFREGKIESKVLSMAAYPMRKKNVPCSFFIGKSMGLVKKYYASTFYKFKSIIVNKAKVKRA